MKKLTLLFLTPFILFNCNNESIDEQENACTIENGTFVGGVVLFTQQGVNDFGALCYSKIDGVLQLGLMWRENDIVDLSPLSSLTEVFNGRLRIHATNLTSLYGLHNLTSIGGLFIFNSHGLTDLSGFESLTNIGGGPIQGLDIRYNTSLQSLKGLNNIRTLASENTYPIIIGINPSLNSLIDLSNLETIDTGLTIGANPNLTSLDGLENLVMINGRFKTSIINFPISISGGMSGNSNLTSYCALQNLFTNGSYGEVDISLNAYNPTVQDIIDGNCSQ